MSIHVKARVLFDSYGLTDWKLVVEPRRKLVGQCRFLKKEIMLSSWHEDEWDDCLRHEIAHAIVGPGMAMGRRGRQRLWL